MRLTEPRLRMLTVLADHGGLNRELLFHMSGSHNSGYRALCALVRNGYVKTTVSGSYMNGSDPVTRCTITQKGRDLVKEKTSEQSIS